MKCRSDRRFKCVVNKFDWCKTCDWGLMMNQIKLSPVRPVKKKPLIVKNHSNRTGYNNRHESCIFCVLVGAVPTTPLTKHHLVPNAIAVKHLKKEVEQVVYACHDHHTLLHMLFEPIVIILSSKSPPFKVSNWYAFNNVIVPKLKSMITDFVGF